jgi:amino acid adenylation domain-containing protein
VIDLSGLGGGSRAQAAQRLVGEEARRPFDLSRGPLLRCGVLRLGAGEHVVMLMMHHIVSDGWSMGVLINEMSRLYEAYERGEESPLEELPIQYADYAIWQREWLQGEVLEKQLEYWKEQLAGAPPVLELPTDRPRSAVQSSRGARCGVYLDPELKAGLKRLGQQEGATMFMTLLAAYQTLLHRYSGQAEVVVGIPVANRQRAETEGLIGFFVNTLALRASFEGDQSFRELLRQVRERALGAYAHQDLPFERLVEELRLDRSLNRTPLFQAIFTLQNFAPARAASSGERAQLSSSLAISSLGVEVGAAKFDLTMILEESSDEIGGSLGYRTDIFERESINRLVGHFKRLLEGVVEQPNCCLSRLPLLSHAELKQLLVDYNQTRKDYPSETTVHHIFGWQARRSPESVAVVYREQQLSYEELERRSNQLAHHLRRLGVGPEARVGLLLERSVEMMVVLLGVMKAGGAYLPLDPAYPVERLEWMLKDAGASVLLTHRGLRGHLGDFAGEVVEVEDEWAQIAGESEQAPVDLVCGENLAHVLYTSGTTGRPKGVAVLHRGVVRLVWEAEYMSFGAGAAMLHVGSISFDAATLEFWGPLLNGGRCVMLPEQIATPRVIGEAVARHRVTAAVLTTALFNAVIDEGPEALAGMRQLLVGGEEICGGHVRRAQKALPGLEITNVYGPTESTAIASCHLAGQVREDEEIPIGRPINNTRIYVLSRELNPTPLGVIGEIYIGGDGLARGYWERAELSAERFWPDPFSDRAGERMYKTGDLGRWRPEWRLEFVGRNDWQVKVRGFRIELGEVEQSLREQAGIKEAVVLVGRDRLGEKQLRGYYIAERAEGPEASEVRRDLTRRLPAHLIPSSLIRVDSWPLTPNGKVDRERLLAKAETEEERGGDRPEGETEKWLAEMWKELLVMKEVGRDENFFELGGHSLLLARAHRRIVEQKGVEMTIVEMFRYPTIRALGQRIDVGVERRSKEKGAGEELKRMADGRRRLITRLGKKRGSFPEGS